MDRRERLNELQESVRLAQDGRQATMWTALPCIVQSVDLEAMTITAQPAIKATVTNEQGVGNLVNLPLLLDVPICFPSAGGFTLTLPIAQGDEVLVVFSSRAIDSWWQSGDVGRPVEARMHDLSDGFAIVGPRSQPRVIPNISSTNLQIRNDTGDTYIEITPNGVINLVASMEVNVTTPHTNVISPEILLDGNVFITGALTQSTGSSGTATLNGSLHVTGSVTSDGDVVASGVSLEHHVHSGVQSGPSNTGEPV